MGIRERLRNLEREAEGEYDALVCRECGERFQVAVDTDLAYLAWEWAQEMGERSYQETPADVFLIAEHAHGDEHPLETLVYEATGKPWPEILNRPKPIPDLSE